MPDALDAERLTETEAGAFGARTRAEIEALAHDEPLQEASRAWIAAAARHRYSHHFTWMGLPIIQFPTDVLALQEIIWRVRPDLIVETGVARGGSLVFYASMLELIGGRGLVAGVEIDLREPNRAALESHPMRHRIRVIEGSSVEPGVVEQVRAIAADRERVLVVLDSHHTHEHVSRELETYAPLVTAGSYLVVLDTIIEELPAGYFGDRPWDRSDNPMTAVRAFLAGTDRFEVDAEIPAKLLITVAPGGYLRCVRDDPARIADAPRAIRRPIPVSGPWITEAEVARVAEAARTGWQENAGLHTGRFETAFAQYVGRDFAMALPSCTSAIHLSLAALGVGPGDEVVVPDLTWIASAAPIDYVGATPVFADVDPGTWCLSPESFASVITPRTKAVIAVDLYGTMPDLPRIVEIARRHGIAVIEDAAQAIGSGIGERRAGSFGDAGVFSFHGSKTLTTGEGGMLVTDDAALHERCRVLRDHGRAPGDRWFFNDEVAFKYRMSAVQAALGLAQLERVDEIVARKRATFTRYRDGLAGLDGVRLNPEPAGTSSGFWMVTALFDPAPGLDKRAVIDALAADGIDSRPLFHPLSSLPAYAGRSDAARAARENRVAYRLAPYGVNLPSGLDLTAAEVRRVCDALRVLVAGHSSPGGHRADEARA